MCKPKEFWISESKQDIQTYDYTVNEDMQHEDDIQVIEKSAYDKAIEALKYIATNDATLDDITYCVYAEEILKELGELDDDERYKLHEYENLGAL